MKLKTTYARDGSKVHEIDGKPATQEEVDRAFPPHSLEEMTQVRPQGTTTWPMSCIALGVCTRKQAVKEMERCRKLGFPIEFTDEATPRAILTGREHRKAYCKLRGLRDQDGGYGDHT